MRSPRIADEVDVPVTAGDVVVVDARLIHGAHPNRSEGSRAHQHHALVAPGRTRALPATDQGPHLGRSTSVQESIPIPTPTARSVPDTWPEPHRSQALPFVVTDPGPAEPEPWIRTPKY